MARTKRKLTVRLAEDNLDFVKRYAAEHGLTVTDVLERYLSRLRASDRKGRMHPSVKAISGVVPPDADVRALYHEHLLEKHR
jgi:uncharacterized protein involved in type VI secretion and phage assembly